MKVLSLSGIQNHKLYTAHYEYNKFVAGLSCSKNLRYITELLKILNKNGLFKLLILKILLS